MNLHRRAYPSSLAAALFAAAALALTLFFPTQARAQAGTGTISGRVLNEGTGQYLRNAEVKVVGTNISAVAGPGGNYTLIGVPAGTVRLAVSYANLDPVEEAVTVTAGQTATRDFGLKSASDGQVLQLGAFVVATEREGNAKAMQDQRQSLEIKTVMASDAFGDVSEGNVGEFLKLMPGVQMDYVEADVRTMSIGGLDPKYSTIMMDGAPIASAGSSSIGTGRTFEFEQLSIASIESIELSKTPTPDAAGSALAGIVNLRSKGAFDRRGRQITWQTSLGFNSLDMDLKKTPGPDDQFSYKVSPNLTLSYSDVFKGRFGVLAGYNYSYSFAEQKANTNSFVFDADRSNNATEIPRLQSINLQDSPKPTVRQNYNVRLDFKITNDLFAWVRADYNTYKAEFFSRDVNFDFRNPTGNTNTTVNSPGSTVPANPAVPYTLLDQTSTTGRVTLDLNHGGQRKYGSTTTWTSGVSYRRGAFTGDLLGSFSRSTNYYKDVSLGFFNNIGTGQLPLNGVRWTRSSADNPDFQITSLGNVNFSNPALYPGVLTGNSNDRRGEDLKFTGKGDFRYAFHAGPVPINLKFGGSINEGIRQIARLDGRNYTYLGKDLVANSGDETIAGFIEPNYKMSFPFGTNVQNFPNVDRWALAREFGAFPERFTKPSAVSDLSLGLRNRWYTKEQINALYMQPIVKVTPRFDIAPGVRWEQTLGNSVGPNDIGGPSTQRILTGSPTGTAPTDTVAYVTTRYGSRRAAATKYDTWLKYLHANFRLNENITLRGSYNESITRPDLNRLAGGVIITDELASPPTASVPNPDLQPERGRNMFVSAEYYFPKGGGFFTVSFARRDLQDLIRNTPEDIPVGGSFDGDPFFGGWRINTADNVAKAHTSSLEFNYNQNLGFLGDRGLLRGVAPGFWRRVNVFANYSHLRFDNYENFRRPTHGANTGISLTLRQVSMRWSVNYTPAYRTNAYPANGWANLNDERMVNDAQFNWNFRRNMTFFVTGRNVFNKPVRTLYGSPSVNILNRYFEAGSLWTAGVKGSF